MDFIVSSKKLKENQERAIAMEKENKKFLKEEKWHKFEVYSIGFVSGLVFVAVLLNIWL